MKISLSSLLTIFAVTLLQTLSAQVAPVASTIANPTWYYIESAKNNQVVTIGTTSFQDFKDYVIYSPATDGKVLYKKITYSDNEKWAIVSVNGINKLLNKGTGKYLTGSYSVNPTGEEFKWINYAGTSQYKISTSTFNPMIAWNNLTCDRYSDQGANSQTAWFFKDAGTPTAMVISNIAVSQGRLTTGIGNKDFAVLYFTIVVGGSTGEAILESIRMNMDGTTNIADIGNLKIYKLDSPKFNSATAILIGNGNVASGDISITANTPLNLVSGDNYFCAVVDVNETAKEGNLVDASLLAVKLVGVAEKAPTVTSPPNAATIFLTQSLLFTPGDYGSKSYRIPAIITAKDGSLITATDKRNNTSTDLPSDIDQYIRRSTDNGKTWSNVLMIAGATSTLGYGDPALAVDRVTGKIICLVAHDKGFFGSTASAPIKVVSFESLDNGISWSAGEDITNQLYGAGCTNTLTKNWAGMFISSGRGLQLRSGRIMFAGVVRNGVSSNLQVYSVYTDNLGQTWNIGTVSAVDGGDESKFAERNNGDVIVSIRKAPKRFINVSKDKGMTWGTAVQHADLTDPACNGEVLTYTSTIDGYNKNRMLHSLCYAGSRTNVSMLLSYDEGVTFPIRKTICAASSAYSTFTILKDGTIGMYFEDGSTGNTYDMVYVRFSLDWLTGSADTYVAASPTGLDSSPTDKIRVRSENGQIIVSGTNSDYQIYTLLGAEVSKRGKLNTGIYIVRVDNIALKVFVN